MMIVSGSNMLSILLGSPVLHEYRDMLLLAPFIETESCQICKHRKWLTPLSFRWLIPRHIQESFLSSPTFSAETTTIVIIPLPGIALSPPHPRVRKPALRL